MSNLVVSAVLVGMLTACASDLPDADDPIVPVEDIGERTLAQTTQPWTVSDDFATIWHVSNGNVVSARTPYGFSRELSLGNQEYEVAGNIHSGDNTSWWIGSSGNNVAWGLGFRGPTNYCVTQGCTFLLCGQGLSSGWGTCTWVLPQNAVNPSTTWFYGNTSHFNGKRWLPYETLRWTMYIYTAGWWPNPAYVNELSVTAVQ